MAEALVVEDEDKVAKGCRMHTTATLYRNGTLELKNRSWSENWLKGLKGHSLFAIILGENGRALGVSKLYYPPTVGAFLPKFAGCDKIQTYVDYVPEEVAQAAVGINVVHNEGPVRDNWKQLVDNVKRVIEDAEDINEKLKAAALDDLTRLLA